MIHAGYVLFIAVCIIYFFLNKYHGFWNVAFIVSLFFTAASLLNFLDDLTPYLPANLQRFIMYYANEDILAEKMQSQARIPMYARILRLLPRIMVNVLVAICLMNRKKLSNKYHSDQVLSFLVILMCIVNITLSIPSVGVRFLRLAVPFVVYLYVVNSHLSNQYYKLIYLIPFAYSYEILYWVRHMISISEWYLYILPLPLSFLHYL